MPPFVFTPAANASQIDPSVFDGFGEVQPGTSNSETINGTAENSILFGYDGNDTLRDTHSDDLDIFIGGAGNDTLIGNDGIDIFLYLGSITPPTIPTPANPETPVDLTVTTATEGVDVIQNFRADQDMIMTVMSVSPGSALSSLTGDANHNFMVGDDRNNTITGGSGNDILLGGAGADSLSGGEHDDVLIGGTGNDTLTGGNGNNILVGGQGHDRFNFNGSDVTVEWQDIDGDGKINDLIVSDSDNFNVILNFESEVDQVFVNGSALSEDDFGDSQDHRPSAIPNSDHIATSYSSGVNPHAYEFGQWISFVQNFLAVYDVRFFSLANPTIGIAPGTIVGTNPGRANLIASRDLVINQGMVTAPIDQRVLDLHSLNSPGFNFSRATLADNSFANLLPQDWIQ